MVRIKSLTLLAATAIVVTACGTENIFHDAGRPQVVAAPDKVSMMLAESATRASSALETLAAVEQARAPDAQVGNIGQAPSELRRAITVNWIGPVEPIAKTLADRAGYQFLTIGSAPPVPVVVSVDVENRPVIDVLRDLGLQLGVRGDVKVDAGRRMVEIHYPPTTGVGG